MRASLPHAMNELVLVLISAWGHDKDTISRAYVDKNRVTPSPAVLGELYRRVNRIDALVTLAILASRGLRDGTRRESMSLRKLAMTQEDDAQSQKAAENALRRIVLPSLADLGWINDFKPQRPGERNPHAITISMEGLEAHGAFLRRCYEDLRPLMEELDQAYRAGAVRKTSGRQKSSRPKASRGGMKRGKSKPEEIGNGQRNEHQEMAPAVARRGKLVGSGGAVGSGAVRGAKRAPPTRGVAG